MFHLFPQTASDNVDKIIWFQSDEIVRDETLNELYPYEDVTTVTYNGYTLKMLKRQSVMTRIRKQSPNAEICEAEEHHSDLVTAKYEGGLKIWECTDDLANFISKDENVFQGKDVLDLGCGAGVLGLLALTMKAKSVHFQDYNSDVICYWTIPNVNLNEKQDQCRYWSGDWKHFSERVQETYDIILSSETIYNPNSHEKLCHLLEKKLKPDGAAYFSGKSYYFGVGGSMGQFAIRINEGQKLKSERVWKSQKGVQREILKITRSSDT